MPKSMFQDSGVSCIHYGHIYTRYGISTSCAVAYVDPDYASTLTTVNPGDLVVANTSENLEDVGTAVAWSGSEKAVTGGHATVIKSNQNSKYLSYYFRTPSFFSEKRKHAFGTKVVELSAKNLARIPVPLPPLEVQNEITRTLDQLTQLEVELEAELEARQQQYTYYRDILVAPPSPREPVKLGKVSHIARGASPRPIRKFITNDSGIPWIKIGDVPPQGKYITTTAQHISTDGAEKSRQIKPGDFILSNSMSFGRPYISKINGCIHDGWLVISNYEKTFDPDFLYHVLRSSPIQNGFAQRAGSGTVRNLNSKIVSETLVPAPPIGQQREIVHLLNKFDLLVNDLTSGLPAEIEARRKQYEYYRDRLLNLPRKELTS